MCSLGLKNQFIQLLHSALWWHSIQLNGIQWYKFSTHGNDIDRMGWKSGWPLNRLNYQCYEEYLIRKFLPAAMALHRNIFTFLAIKMVSTGRYKVTFMISFQFPSKNCMYSVLGLKINLVCTFRKLWEYISSCNRRTFF